MGSGTVRKGALAMNLYRSCFCDLIVWEFFCKKDDTFLIKWKPMVSLPRKLCRQIISSLSIINLPLTCAWLSPDFITWSSVQARPMMLNKFWAEFGLTHAWKLKMRNKVQQYNTWICLQSGVVLITFRFKITHFITNTTKFWDKKKIIHV